MEKILLDVISAYSAQLWLAFISLVITSFALFSIKDFVNDLFYYASARMSDIGFGQKIYWKNKLYIVKEIKFRYLIIYDNAEIIRIPLKTYMTGPMSYPNPTLKN